MILRPILAAGVAVMLATSARAEVFPARSGELGMLDVPDAETAGVGGGQIAVEMGFDKSASSSSDFGPLPIYAVGGVADRLDLGFTMRAGGQPGDAHPARTLFGAAAKLQLWAPSGAVPGAALSLALDGLNARSTTGLRLALSTPRGRVRFAAFGGAESEGVSGGAPGWTAGLAARFPFTRDGELVLEALTGPRGKNYGFAVRRLLRPSIGVSVGANYFPEEEGFRVSLGIAFPPPRASRVAPEGPKIEVAPVTPAPTTVGPRFTEARPRFRLRMPLSAQRLGEPGRQHGPWTPTVAAAAPMRPAGAVPTAVPTVDDLADAQLRDQEALADGRERRVRATSDELDNRHKAALEEVARFQQREIDLLAREQQLDARDRRIAVRGTPTQQQRDLQSLEAQLAAQERNLTAQDRSFAAALDAARGRERDATAREEAEREGANRLASSAASAASRSLQLDLRRQALAARNRRLAALEARLVAKGEQIDAAERQNRVKRDRLDAFQRRLDARSERLDLIERHTEPKPAPAGPAAPTDSGATSRPKDKAVFVMVVKTPSSIVKGQPSAVAAPSGGAAGHPGVSMEKVVTAATVITFATPASQLSELDRDTIDRIAKLAAKDHCELMIWARAKDPSLQGEAQRRAAEIKAHAVAAGPLDERQVTTRVTIRPAANGVDVVVTALRETATPAPAAPAAPSAPAPSGPSLEGGEGGKRQIRQVVQLAQGSIEACVADMMDRRKLARADGVLKLTISTAGKVAKVAVEGDLGGTAVAECLTGASSAWVFPHADAEYVVDVPIAVMRGEAAR